MKKSGFITGRNGDWVVIKTFADLWKLYHDDEHADFYGYGKIDKRIIRLDSVMIATEMKPDVSR